jgi:hypothetical protein
VLLENATGLEKLFVKYAQVRLVDGENDATSAA